MTSAIKVSNFVPRSERGGEFSRKFSVSPAQTLSRRA